MDNTAIRIPVDQLKNFMRDVFIKSGVPSADADVCAEVLLASDTRGIESHGIGRLKMYYDRIKSGQQNTQTNFDIIRQSPTTAVVDGHHGMGMIVGTRAMQMAIDKAKTYGMGSVAVRNSTHFGIAGYYSLMAVKAGMIGLTVTNARPSIAPTFGVQPMLGTNPIAFGAPSDEEFPFIFDAATSIIQRGKVEVYTREGKPVHPGWVIGSNGEELSNSTQILDGMNKFNVALLPLGGPGEDLSGYKGYGLATMVEILSAALQGGAFLYGLTGFASDGTKQPFKLGHFFMAINVESFIDLAEFKKITGNILRELRDSNKAPGYEHIFTAGEKEFLKEKETRRDGIPVVAETQKEIKFMQQELGLTEYHFPF